MKIDFILNTMCVFLYVYTHVKLHIILIKMNLTTYYFSKTIHDSIHIDKNDYVHTHMGVTGGQEGNWKAMKNPITIGNNVEDFFNDYHNIIHF